MKKVLLLSHGKLAQEMKNTIEMILGKQDCLNYINLPYGKDISLYRHEIEEKLSEAEDTLIFVDIFGGSPFMTSSKIYGALEDKSKIAIIAGMNLPMVIEVVSTIDQFKFGELKEAAIKEGKKGIKDFAQSFND